MHVRRMIRRHFSERISAEDEARMRAHLRGCEGCRSEYSNLAELMRVAAGQTPTRTEMNVLREAVTRSLFGPSQPPVRPGFGTIHHWAINPLVAVLTCSLLLVFGYLTFSSPPSPHSSVQYRGGKNNNPLVSVEIFTIQQQGDEFSSPRLLAGDEAIELDSFLQFRYKNSDARLKHLYLVGLDGRGRPLDYFPRPDQQESISIRESSEGEIISPSIRLSQRHHEGPLGIYAFFSDTPLARKTVHGWFKNASIPRTTGAFPDKICPDPEVSVLTYRFKLVQGSGY